MNGYVHFEFAHVLKLARAQPVGIKNPGTKTTQVNAHMAAADHDRQGQAAHRQYHQNTPVCLS